MPESETPKPMPGRRRRGRRGGRGRRRGPASSAPPAATGQPETGDAREQPPLLDAVAGAIGQMSVPATDQGSAISGAIEEISRIVESLRRVLEQMEEVLELAELAERQKTADEQEIESLRRALRQLHRPGGHRRRDDESPLA